MTLGACRAKLTHQILQGVDAEQAIKQILERRFRIHAGHGRCSCGDRGWWRARCQSDEAGVFAGLFVGTAIVLTDSCGSRRWRAAQLIRSATRFEHSRPGRRQPEPFKAVERWLNNASAQDDNR